MSTAALPPKNVRTAYLLMLLSLVGVCGIQHFYLGKIGRGILWLLTVGLFGIGTIVDIFTLPSQTKTINARRAVGIS
ncbi:MAG: TM2 domain-containing protein [Protaetiibacter sp.]